MYQQDRQWEGSFASQVTNILNANMAHLAVLSIASDARDKKQATDFELKLTGGTIAVRLRRPWYSFRDLTIRSQRDNGVKTELAKLKEGHAFRYFYGWVNEQNIIAEWMLVDLDKVRAVGLLDKTWQQIPNKGRDGKPDGTHFIAIPYADLKAAGCIIDAQFKTTQVPRHRGGQPEGGYLKQMGPQDKAS